MQLIKKTNEARVLVPAHGGIYYQFFGSVAAYYRPIQEGFVETGVERYKERQNITSLKSKRGSGVPRRLDNAAFVYNKKLQQDTYLFGVLVIFRVFIFV